MQQSVERFRLRVPAWFGDWFPAIATAVSIGIVTVQPGETTSFTPGDLHVMAFELDPTLEAGNTTKVTLTMAGGSTMEFDAEIMPADAER